MQLVLGAKIIDVDPSSTEENELLKSAKKLLGLVICVVEAVAYVLSGMYAPYNFYRKYILVPPPSRCMFL